MFAGDSVTKFWPTPISKLFVLLAQTGRSIDSLTSKLYRELYSEENSVLWCQQKHSVQMLHI